MKTFKELIQEGSSVFDLINATAKKAGLKKKGVGNNLEGWFDNNENKLSMQDMFKVVRKAGFVPVKNKQQYKSFAGIHWTFEMPKAGAYMNVTLTLTSDKSNGEYVRRIEFESESDKT